MDFPAIRLDRVVLRGSAATVTHARAKLPATLAHRRWPAAGDDAILILRRVAVRGTVAELPARAAAAADHIARRAADPWSATADSADAVRFSSTVDYRACLIHDLLAGTDSLRWIWRHRRTTSALGVAKTVAAQLAEDVLALPALLMHPGLQARQPQLWRAIDASAARAVLQAIGAATGWHAAIGAALHLSADATPPEFDRGRNLAPQHSQSFAAHPQLTPPPLKPAAHEPARSAAHVARADTSGTLNKHRSLRPIRTATTRQAILHTLAGLPPNDPRVVLQAVIELWFEAPAQLCSSSAATQLHKTALELINHAAQACPDPAHQPHRPEPNPAITNSTIPAQIPAQPPASSEAAAPDSVAPTPAALSSATETSPPSALSTPQISSTRAIEHDFLSRSGSLLFLLNVLNLPVLRTWRAELIEARAGWRELARFALRIGVRIDSPLADFLVDVCDLDPESNPLTALDALGPGHDDSTVDAAARRFHGDAALAALCVERPTRVRATASRVDLHLRLSDLSLDIRRTGLDIDPGWLPWLGCVVRFHYDRGGFTP